MDKTPAAWGPRASKNVRGTVNCNREESTTPTHDHTRIARPTFDEGVGGAGPWVPRGVGRTAATP